MRTSLGEHSSAYHTLHGLISPQKKPWVSTLLRFFHIGPNSILKHLAGASGPRFACALVLQPYLRHLYFSSSTATQVPNAVKQELTDKSPPDRLVKGTVFLQRASHTPSCGQTWSFLLVCFAHLPLIAGLTLMRGTPEELLTPKASGGACVPRIAAGRWRWRSIDSPAGSSGLDPVIGNPDTSASLDEGMS